MAGGYVSTPTDPIGVLMGHITEIKNRLSELERPTGTQTANALKTLQQLVNDLPGQIYAVLATAVNTGTVNATGNVSAGGVVTGNVVRTTSGPTTNITAARVTSWLQNSDGTIGTATSSRRFKTAIEPAALNVEALLSIEPKHYRYRAEIQERTRRRLLDVDDKDFDLDYRVATEIGLIAEELHEAGLWEFVIYEEDRATPWGIHYQMLSVGLLEVARAERDARVALEGRVAALELAQGL